MFGSFGRARRHRISDMDRTQIIDEELNAVAAHLRERREAILDAWRAAADADPQLTTFRVILPRRYQPEPPE
jgi:hypothetical protein